VQHLSRQTFAIAALLILLALAPFPASANHGTPAGPDEQRQVLRPDLRAEIDLAPLPSYTIVATIDLTTATLQAEQHVYLTGPTDHPLDSIVFRLLPNAKTIYGGGSLTVDQIRRGAAPAPWTVSPDGTVLTVSLEPPLPPGETVALELEFSVVIPGTGSGYNIFHHSASVTSLAEWYPVLAPYEGGWQVTAVPAVGDANHFTTGLYDVILTAPATHTVVSTGATLDVHEDGESRVWHLVSGPARGFAIALSDRFEVHSAEWEGVTINYYALPSNGGRSPREALRIAVDSFRAFSRRFGPYPYNEFDVVETLVTVGGYEFAGIVFIQRSLRAGGSLSQLRFIVSHEVAHQWWYALVGSDPVIEPWLDESLATYSVALYLEDTYGAEARRGMLAYFAGEGGRPNGDAPGIDVSALDYVSWPAYRGPVYYRGALFLEDLRREMGDDAFFGMLRAYTLEHRFGFATTRDLTAAAERFAGRPLDDLFRLWFGTPDPGI
jgi:hypothetical protein